MSDDYETFAEVDPPIVCPVCDTVALEYRVCVKCEQKVGMACCTENADGDAVCNDCKETPT